MLVVDLSAEVRAEVSAAAHEPIRMLYCCCDAVTSNCPLSVSQ
jgi:hypothetical protein